MAVFNRERATFSTRSARAEDRIREQEMELCQIMDLTPQHLGVLGPDGSALYTNHVGLEYLGVGIDRWRANASRMGVAPDDRERLLGQRKSRLLEGTAHEYEVRLRRHDGTFRWF
jgi:PAS domain S-box-containing protein